MTTHPRPIESSCLKKVAEKPIAAPVTSPPRTVLPPRKLPVYRFAIEEDSREIADKILRCTPADRSILLPSMIWRMILEGSIRASISPGTPP